MGGGGDRVCWAPRAVRRRRRDRRRPGPGLGRLPAAPPRRARSRRRSTVVGVLPASSGVQPASPRPGRARRRRGRGSRPVPTVRTRIAPSPLSRELCAGCGPPGARVRWANSSRESHARPRPHGRRRRGGGRRLPVRLIGAAEDAERPPGTAAASALVLWSRGGHRCKPASPGGTATAGSWIHRRRRRSRLGTPVRVWRARRRASEESRTAPRARAAVCQEDATASQLWSRGIKKRRVGAAWRCRSSFPINWSKMARLMRMHFVWRRAGACGVAGQFGRPVFK